jgi:hypothetical protein
MIVYECYGHYDWPKMLDTDALFSYPQIYPWQYKLHDLFMNEVTGNLIEMSCQA